MRRLVATIFSSLAFHIKFLDTPAFHAVAKSSLGPLIYKKDRTAEPVPVHRDAMGSRQDAKQEKIIKELLRLPDNRRCVNCDSLVRDAYWC